MRSPHVQLNQTTGARESKLLKRPTIINFGGKETCSRSKATVSPLILIRELGDQLPARGLIGNSKS